MNAIGKAILTTIAVEAASQITEKVVDNLIGDTDE